MSGLDVRLPNKGMNLTAALAAAGYAQRYTVINGYPSGLLL